MSPHRVSIRLDALRSAGIGVREQRPHRYKVGPGFSHWPSTDRWRSPCNGSYGDGVRSLIRPITSQRSCELSGQIGPG
jgi:hypothetical protein